MPPVSDGSMPSLPYSSEPSRVPHTLVAAIPNLAQITPRPAGMPFEHAPHSSGHPQSGPYSAQPAAAPGVSRIAVMIIVAGVVAVCAVLGILYVKRVSTLHTTVAPETSASVAAVAQPAPFTLTIESQPTGATVTEGETSLGDTPLNVAIDRDSVAKGPRIFVVKKEGYAPSQVVQGASTDSVHSVVALAPLAPLAPEGSAAVKSKPAGSGKPVAQGPVKPPASAGPANTGNGPGLDIRLKR